MSYMLNVIVYSLRLILLFVELCDIAVNHILCSSKSEHIR